ncbi:MAG: hypothetical protein KAX23_01850 [Dehalococcoidia bacterium]|nr:hypothetical protein [Dehalococcoidia bacterium]
MTVVNDSEFIASLNEQIEKHDKELGRLLEEKQSLEAMISEVQQWLERAIALREVESRKLGIPAVAQPPTAEERRFFGMTARDACRAVLRERGRSSKPEMVEALKRGGFNFGNKNPRRVVHFALVRDRNVRKAGHDSYEWIENKEKGASELTLFRQS